MDHGLINLDADIITAGSYRVHFSRRVCKQRARGLQTCDAQSLWLLGSAPTSLSDPPLSSRCSLSTLMPDKKISPEPAEDEYTLKAKIRQVLRLHKDARAGTRILDVDFLKNPREAHSLVRTSCSDVHAPPDSHFESHLTHLHVASSMRFRLNVDEPNEELVRTSPSAVCWPICTGRIGLETPLTKDHKAGEIFRYEPILEARGMNNPYLAYVPWNDRKACCYTKPAPVRSVNEGLAQSMSRLLFTLSHCVHRTPPAPLHIASAVLSAAASRSTRPRSWPRYPKKSSRRRFWPLPA